MLLFSTKVSQAAFTKVIMPVIGRKGTIKRGKYQRKINFSLNFLFEFSSESTLFKGTNKRAKYKIKIIIFLLSSESTLSKGTIKRGKYQRKTRFFVNLFRKMSTLSGKRLSTFSGKCQRFQEIKPTHTPPKKEGKFNLYQGLRAIHSTFWGKFDALLQ